MENLKKSNALKITLIVIGEILILFLVFSSGVAVGLRKAHFSYKFGENYERNFMGPHIANENRPDFLPQPPRGFMNNFEGKDFRNAHGIAGKIISISENSIIVVDRDNKENTILITDKTFIKSRRDDLKVSDLKTGDEIVVMGNPDINGVINASLIRIFNPNDITN
ncbi:MAG: hypothetical protein WA055_01870 [Candidatus Moraniibacteriota bacterium]